MRWTSQSTSFASNTVSLASAFSSIGASAGGIVSYARMHEHVLTTHGAEHQIGEPVDPPFFDRSAGARVQRVRPHYDAGCLSS